MKTRRATVSFKTVGCRLNQAETAEMRAAFEEAGFEPVPFGESCDVCVIHGCVVTARAEEDSLRLVRAVRRRCPGALVALAGCAADLARSFNRAPEGVDILAGRNDKFNLPEIIGFRRRSPPDPAVTPMPSFTTQRAIVKIQDGCDCRCAYCIVPLVRGKNWSRPSAEIIAEINRLVLAGFGEVVLTGANAGCYADGKCRLPQLLEKIELIPGLARFRLSSIEPSTVEREVIDFMASSKKMCRFLHLPLQSGSDRVLAAMRRPCGAAQFSETVEYAANKLGRIGLGTDLIAGFPGETERDFEATLATVSRLPFNLLHVFNFSPRPGTEAAALGPGAPPGEKARRSAALISLGRAKREEFARSFTGASAILVTEKILPDGRAEGWTGEYLRARASGGPFQLRQAVEFTCERACGDILEGRSDGTGRAAQM